MLDDLMVDGSFTLLLVQLLIGLLLLVLGCVIGYQYVKRRYKTEIEQLTEETMVLKQALSQVTSQHQQLKQDHAGLKYELGSLKRDKAYLESKLCP